jgi:hypothetical protein
MSIKKITLYHFVLIVLLLQFGCSNNRNRKFADYFYKNNRHVALTTFKNIGIFEREDYLLLLIYSNNDSVAGFKFKNYDKNDFSKLSLVDSLSQDKIKMLEKILNVDSSKNIKFLLLKYFYEILQKMEVFNLIEISHNKKQLGIDTEYYLSWSDVILYIPDAVKVTNSNWKNVLNNAHKYDDSWYYYKIKN